MTKAVRFFLGSLFVLCIGGPSPAAQSIVTVAGGGTDDGRPATLASLSMPDFVAIDARGNLYIADTFNNRIRKVSADSGIITTIAGLGTQGFSGDGGAATQAGIANPRGVAVDPAGNIYIADNINGRIRKITAATGIITTVAGGGSGISDTGPATSVRLFPYEVVVDAAGNLYIANKSSHKIYRLNMTTGLISTFAGNGQDNGMSIGTYSGDGGPATLAGLNNPEGLALDAAGNVYIADTLNQRIRRVSASTGIITTVAGNGAKIGDFQGTFSGDGGPATTAGLNVPTGVAVDGAGNIYISDSLNLRVRKVDAATGIITTVAGGVSCDSCGDGGPASAAGLRLQQGVSVDAAGNVYLTDGSRIRRISAATGIIDSVAGARTEGGGFSGFVGDGGPATSAGVNEPYDVTFDRSGNMFIADTRNQRIRRVDAVSGTIATIAGGGNRTPTAGETLAATAAQLNQPEGIAVDGLGNLFIADNNRVYKVGNDGRLSVLAGDFEFGFSGDGGPATAAKLAFARDVAVDPSGNVYIADHENYRVRRVDAATGIITTFAGNGVFGFSGDGGPATAASMGFPEGLAFDAAGNLYIVDSENDRIRKVAAGTGVITTAFDDVDRGRPIAVAVDRDGSLLIASLSRGPNVNPIRRVVPGAGRATAVAGRTESQPEFSGDGGPATRAGLASPQSVAVDGEGNIFIADTLNSRIRAVFACINVGPPQLQTPSNGSVAVATAPRLGWSGVKGAFRYDVYLDTVNPPQKIVAANIVSPTFSASNLLTGTTYYWRVVAKGDSFCPSFSTASSETRSFTTATGCASVPVN